MDRNGASYLLTLRLIPVFPFFLINFLAGLTKVPLRTFLWTTSLGIIPGTVVFAFAGQQLGSINSPADILSKKVIAAFLRSGFSRFVPADLEAHQRRQQDIGREIIDTDERSEVPWRRKNRLRKY